MVIRAKAPVSQSFVLQMQKLYPGKEILAVIDVDAEILPAVRSISSGLIRDHHRVMPTEMQEKM